MQSLTRQLAQRKAQGTIRSLNNYHTQGVDFFSNDYLGLARHEELAQRIAKALVQFPQSYGSTGSRLISGNHPYYTELEAYLARAFQAPSGLLFNSGYMANLGVFSSLPQRGDVVLYDEHAHACIKDGIRLSMATKYPFRHNDVEDLQRKLALCTGTVYLAVESVYSMHGDQAPLEALVRIKQSRPHTYLIVDEAHTTGLYHGQWALTNHLSLQAHVDVRIHTFGKAMGSHGAWVAASELVVEYLVNFCRPFIYTTAMPLHQAVSMWEGVRFLAANPELQHKLRRAIDTYKTHTQGIEGFSDNDGPIQWYTHSTKEQLELKTKQLQDKGFKAKAIWAPTVKKGEERIRICLHGYNTEEEILQMVEVLASK